MNVIDLYYDAFHHRIVSVEGGIIVRNVPPDGFNPIAEGIEVRNRE